MINFHNKAIKNFFAEAKKSLNNLKSIKTGYKEIPNFLTLSRFVFIPFIIVNILGGNLIGAGILTGMASLTDYFDGFLARKLNATSEFGRQLDAFIDKIFIISVALPLATILPHLLLPIALDIIIASINGYSHLKGYEPKTSKWGRRKTIFLDSLIASSFFANIPIFLPIQIGLYVLTVGLQIKTSVDYYQSFRDAQKNDLEEKKEEVVINQNNILDKNKEKELEKTLSKKEILEYYKQCLYTEKKETEEEKTLILKKK